MVCLETSFLVALIRNDGRALAKLTGIEETGEKVTTTPICVCELFAGAYTSRQPEKEAGKIREILKRVELLDFTLEVCEEYGKIWHGMKSSGRQIGDLDTLIASAALSHGESILTSNARHFKGVPGLEVQTS